MKGLPSLLRGGRRGDYDGTAVLDELEATIAARRELDRRVDERIALRTPPKRRPSPLHPGNLGVSIPIIAIAGGNGDLAGLIVAFVTLAVVFGVAEFRR